jgi:hypothetical protein
VVPQVLKVQFNYFAGRIAWRPIVVSAVLLLLGNLAGVLMFGQHFGRMLRGRLHVGRARGDVRATGSVVPPTTLAAIRPGESTYDDVVRLCGLPDEETDALGTAPRRTLVYRGRRTIPRRRLTLGWVATVDGWRVEDHEVVVTLESDRVRDVDSRIRRSRTH